MKLACVDGPLCGEVHYAPDHLCIGDRVLLRVPRVVDPDAPVYLPYDDPRNSPAEHTAVYMFDGQKLVSSS
jgi:hypothetical protein